MKKIHLLLTVAVIFIVSSVFLTVEASAGSALVTSLENQQKSLLGQRSELENTLVGEMSGATLEEKSIELGFGKPKDLMYLTSSEQVAALR